MDDYVIKPIHEAELQRTLEHAVASPARPPFDSAAPGIDDRAPNAKPSSFSEQAISRVVDSPANAPKPLRILVAEDDVINRSLMLLILKGMGYQADAVADGTEVLEALRKHPYEVILLDVRMPKMDGLEAARHLRAHPPAHPRPYIIALTGGSARDDKAMCIEAGMDDYLSKPIEDIELYGTLRRAAAAHPPRSN